MRLGDERESENVEDRRGGFSIGGGGLGIGGIVIALIASYLFGVNPLTILGLLEGQPTQQSAPAAHAPPPEDQMATFVSKVLASTEDTWQDIFRQQGRQYEDPKLVLFSSAVPTACGTGQAAMGPFYCPNDHKVYIDLSFYRELKERFRAPGDFAEAYVIAHEVGHHVQNLLGIAGKVDAARRRASPAQANALSVRLELQADCFAGVWGKRADAMRHILEPGEEEEALTAAAAIGDDRLQQQTQGRIVPESFTHGTSAQRVEWFRRGFESGDPGRCNTFASRE
ncbi:MAG TPA: neutral zinc metallopeptidase [Rhodocyclaceae bacterium]|nr:neutral zinc metallopeptidase [Rhodocyclaceae bacterium]